MTEVMELHLSDSEKEAIQQLRLKLPADIDKEFKDDTYQLYLFLKAQQFDVNAAESMLTKALQRRKKLQLDLMHNVHPPQAIREYFEKIKIGFTKQASPLYYLPAGKYDVKGICMSAKCSDLEKIVMKNVEEDIRVFKGMRKTPYEPYPGIVVIYDLEGLTFAAATDKKGIEYSIRCMNFFQSCYPGSLKAAYVINMSPYFMIPWSIVKNCLSSSFTSLIKLFGTDDWKEELLKIIDADVLPAFLGGNRTDPDGNPRCKTIVTQGGKIDEKSYILKTKSPLANSPGVEKLVLGRASFKETELVIEEDGSHIEWEFETTTRDIGFGLFYKEIINGEEKITELVPLLRINTEDYSETGVFKCEKAGTYVLLFDNSYSWIRSKEIYYRLKITNPKELEADVQD